MKKVIGPVLLWFFFAIIATLNGFIRDTTYKKLVGDLLAHQISTLIFIFLILIIMYLFFSKISYGFNELWIIGLSWVTATIIFEFIFGHYIFGNTRERLLGDYNLLEGRVWSFVLIFTLIGPWLVGRKIKRSY